MKRSALEWTGWALAALALVALPLLVLNFGLGAPPLRILFGWGAYLIVPGLLAGGLALAFAEQRGWRERSSIRFNRSNWIRERHSWRTRTIPSCWPVPR